MTDEWKRLPLWAHQLDAISLCRNYLDGRRADRNRDDSALVRMPTGTGKSGVIAVVTRCFDQPHHWLVLTPSIVLREQLADDIEKDFWGTKGLRLSAVPGAVKVVRVLPKAIEAQISGVGAERTIFVSTIQSLQRIHVSDKSSYRKLLQLVGAVIFDEGHREPAPDWARSVRELKKPTILFTATPYRNDFQLFNLGKDVFAFSHRKAESERYVRSVKFDEGSFGSSADAFVKELLDLYATMPAGTRVIVRCEDLASIKRVSGRLKSALEAQGKAKLGVVSIHERGEASEAEENAAGLHRRVPSPKKNKAVFWVHQFKLTEGLDDASFRLVGIFHPFGNARSLIQQIGRLIRNPGQKANESAYVLSDRSKSLLAQWQGYRAHEEFFEQNPQLYEARQIFESARLSHPELYYVAGDYRRRFDFEGSAESERFRLPRAANVFADKPGRSLNSIAKKVEEEWRARDLDVRKVVNVGNDTVLIVYLRFELSPAIDSEALLEFRLGCTAIRRMNGFLFVGDTFAASPSVLRQKEHSVDTEKYVRLFHGRRKRITQIAVLSSDLGRHALRRRELYAYSMDGTAPGLADHSNFFTTATGYFDLADGRARRRYVGFSRGRVSDGGKPVTIKQWRDWCAQVARELQASRVRPPEVFSRFARQTSAPRDPRPLNILFDVEDVVNDFELRATGAPDGARGEKIVLEELCFEIAENGEFKLPVNNELFDATLRFEPSENRYVLECSELEARSGSGIEGGRNENLVSLINRHQPFRVLPRDRAPIVYAHSRFYDPRLGLDDRSQPAIDIFRIITSHANLGPCSEKGADGSATNARWEHGCVFDLIHQGDLGEEAQLLRDADLLVCDDLGRNEVADFIAADTKKGWLAFVHAKGFKHQRQASATAMQEVCAQAMKNLNYLLPANMVRPPNFGLWNDRWDGGKIGSGPTRILRGATDADDAWKKIHALSRNPRTMREVWLIGGGALSKRALMDQTDPTARRPELVQMLFLLQSTWSAISQVGASFRVFCSP